MEYDFTALDRLTASAQGRKPSAEGKTPPPVENRSDGLPEPPRGKYYRQLEAERETVRRAAAVYREHQENTIRSNHLVTAITKGIQEGADLYQLLLWSMEAISTMTGDRLFYEQGARNLQTVYEALGYDAPRVHHAQEVQERLDRLTETLEHETSEGRRRSLELAIRAHRRKLDELRAERSQSHRDC